MWVLSNTLRVHRHPHAGSLIDNALRPYFELIDEVETSTRRLEEAAYALDGYVKNLGKFLGQIMMIA